MVEKVISLICDEFGYDESAITESTQLGDLVDEGIGLEEIIHAVEGEFYVDLSEDISSDMTIAAVAEMLE